MKNIKNTLQKKIVVPLAVLAIIALGGSVYTLSHLGPTTAHAQTPTAQVQSVNKAGLAEIKDSATNEKSGTEATAEKGTADGPGGHQDSQGENVDHQFDGVE